MIPRLCTPILDRMQQRFAALYGDETARRCLERVAFLLGRYGVGFRGSERFDTYDPAEIVLITYADMVQAPDAAPLAVLRRFLRRHLRGTINAVHLLPFFPWSSDDGFAVEDYRAVHAEYGTWSDVEAIGKDFSLMFDLVLNHVSRRSEWFRDYGNGIAPGRHYFLETDPALDVSNVTRPRTSPLLTAVQTNQGQRHVWTTFGADQIDLNFGNPDVLFEFLDILFFYLSKGARILRLDAIAYLWKTPGTDCIHRPQTMEIVKLLHDLLEMAAPAARLLTETNVPHAENIAYFGEGDAAHLVYQFPLPPLLLHALHHRDATVLTRWAQSLEPPPPGCAFFNFTASHDGIGVRPLQGLVPDADIHALAAGIRKRGGQVSEKSNPNGSTAPYELNISWLDAVSNSDDPENDIRRLLTTQAVMLALQGMPGVYFHSLFGTRNDREAAKQSGIPRRINRHKYAEAELDARLQDEKSETRAVFTAMKTLLNLRARQPAFHPEASQDVLDLHPACFALRRRSPAPDQTLLCISNFSEKTVPVPVPPTPESSPDAHPWRDLISGRTHHPGNGPLPLPPWQTVWLDALG